MSKGVAEVWICDEAGCGHRWIVTGGLPDRCPSRKCRSRKWNSISSESAVTLLDSSLADLKVDPVLVEKVQVAAKIANLDIGQHESVAEPPLTKAKARAVTARVVGSETVEPAKWCANSKCPHDYQNSFVCERAGGGCRR